MRHSREEAARSHARIVERAATLFRERGIDGIGLADLMHEAGLTHGGFYKHFDSKDGLAAEACAHGLSESARRMRRRAEKNPADPLASVIEGILHMLRREESLDHRGQGIGRVLLRPPTHAPRALGEAMGAGLGGEPVLRIEVLVKAAMGEAGLMHEISETDAVDPALTEQRRGPLDDACMGARRLFPGMSHGPDPTPGGSAKQFG